MKFMRGVVFGVLCGAVVVSGGCHSSNKHKCCEDGTGACCTGEEAKLDGAAGVVNANCPFSSHPVKESVTTADYNGAKVGFCCEDCVDSWAALSDAERQAKFTEMTSKN